MFLLCRYFSLVTLQLFERTRARKEVITLLAFNEIVVLQSLLKLIYFTLLSNQVSKESRVYELKFYNVYCNNSLYKKEDHKIIFQVFLIQTKLLCTRTVVLTSGIESNEKKHNNKKPTNSRKTLRLRMKYPDD